MAECSLGTGQPRPFPFSILAAGLMNRSITIAKTPKVISCFNHPTFVSLQLFQEWFR
jgi:hypothetical protein